MNEPRNSPDDFRETHDLGPCGEPFEELGEVERQLKKVRPRASRIDPETIVQAAREPSPVAIAATGSSSSPSAARLPDRTAYRRRQWRSYATLSGTWLSGALAGRW